MTERKSIFEKNKDEFLPNFNEERTLLENIRSAYGNDILRIFSEEHNWNPDNNKEPIVDLDEHTSYINEREIKEEGSNLKTSKYIFEESFHRKFWMDFNDDFKLFFLIGKEGIGKTSFLEFYFERYFSYYYLSPHAIGPERNKEYYQKKIEKIIYVFIDLRSCKSEIEINTKIYSKIKEVIMENFNNICTESSYLMWDKFVDAWKSETHQTASKNYESWEVYQANIIAPYHNESYNSNKIFVEYALLYIMQYKQQSSESYKFIIVPDNIDQLPPFLQMCVVNFFVDLVNICQIPQNKYKRQNTVGSIINTIIIPIRPETYPFVERFCEPIGARKYALEIGKLNSKSLVYSRFKLLKEHIKSNVTPIGEVKVIEFKGVKEFIWLPSTTDEILKILEDILLGKIIDNNNTSETIFPYFNLENKYDIEARLYPGVLKYFHFLSNSDNRRYLRLRSQLTCSRSVSYLFSRNRNKTSKLSHYYCIDGMILGSENFYNPPRLNSERNLIINIFNTTDCEFSPYSNLIGFHLLFLLMEKDYDSEEITHVTQSQDSRSEIRGARLWWL